MPDRREISAGAVAVPAQVISGRHGRSLSRATIMVGLLMGLGILATLAREVMLARVFGTGPEIEHFRLAFSVPYLLGTSLGAVVVAALAPMVSTDSQDMESMAKTLQTAIVATTILAFGLGVGGVITAPFQVNFLAPGYSAAERSDLLPHVMLLWLFFVLTALTFGPRAFMAVRDIVWPMASASLVLGGTMAAGTLALAFLPVTQQTTGHLVLLALLAASVLLTIHFLALPKGVVKTMLRLSVHEERWTQIAALSLTTLAVVVGHLISAAPRIIDRAVATEMKAGVVAAMDFSFSIITVPGLIFGSVFAIVGLPIFVSAWRLQQRPLIQKLAIYSGYSVLLATGCGAIIAMWPELIVRTLFARGAFDNEAVSLTATLLRWHALAIGPMVASLILGQAALSSGLVRLFFAAATVRIITKLLAVRILVPMHGLDGLAASFIVPELASSLFLLCAIYLTQRGRAIRLGRR